MRRPHLRDDWKKYGMMAVDNWWERIPGNYDGRNIPDAF